ncbi:MAG: hypothetical protein JNK46_14495 [Methylobacteriaceae bacterium]|nr:hypothetical protein [Methylobacteriaceae bacterium]
MRISGLVLSALVISGGFALAQDYPIAGLQPDRRPEAAPKITAHSRDKAFLDRYHRGVTPPFPTTLGAQDQGAWYTPFNRAGMPPPYDPRGWYADVKAPR